jgi:hypothetical protein
MVMKETLEKQIADGTYTMTNKTLTTPKIDQIDEATSGSGVTIDGVLLKDGNADLGQTGALTGAANVVLADNAATSFTPNNVLGVIVLFGRAVGYKGDYIVASWRTAATVFTQLIVGGTTAAVTTGALAGTTGTDGKLTLSTHTDGKIYIENRTGASRSLGWVLLGS